MSKHEDRPEASSPHMALDAPAIDRRASLVRQVLASRTFAKSVRLSHFFEFVCRKTLEGRTDEINEQQIGIHVFGRSSAYSPNDDSIVRTQARLLRQRLEEYFEHECPTCPMIVFIPKGGYVPVFEERAAPPGSNANPQPSASTALIPSALSMGEPRRAWLLGWRAAAGRHPLLWFGSFIFALIALAAAVRLVPRSSSMPPTLWRSIFASGRPVVIVPSDDGLVLFEELSRGSVTLDEYLSGSYLRRLPGQPRSGEATAGWLSSHQYTSTADLSLALRLDRLPEAAAASVTTRYARVLRLDDLKSNNIILIGGIAANPWVELFSHQLNFDVNYDWKAAQGYVLNKRPQAGEQPSYRESPGENSPTSYGVLAYLPGITGEGSTLLFNGSGMAGTEAAADLPFSGEQFAKFLEQLGRGPGGSLPFFEVLLEARSLGGNAPEAHILAWRRVQH